VHQMTRVVLGGRGRVLRKYRLGNQGRGEKVPPKLASNNALNNQNIRWEASRQAQQLACTCSCQKIGVRPQVPVSQGPSAKVSLCQCGRLSYPLECLSFYDNLCPVLVSTMALIFFIGALRARRSFLSRVSNS